MTEEINDDRKRDDDRKQDIEKFGNPYRRYRGEMTPQNLVFDANLQEFAYRVSVICTLENAGKLSPQEAYKQISALWSTLEISKENLLDPQDDDTPS